MTVYYLGYYDTQLNQHEERYCVSSAVTKMNYISDVLSRCGFNVQIVSPSGTTGRRGFRGKTYVLSNRNITVKLFYTIGIKGRITKILSHYLQQIQLFIYLLHVSKKETIIAYHSLGFAHALIWAKKIRHFKLIMEVNEIYQDVSNHFSPKECQLEYRVIEIADAYIFPSKLLDNKLNPLCKPAIINSGNYICKPDYSSKRKDGKIHIVYAGTFDLNKGGVWAAIRSASYLTQHYHLHILGFGMEYEIDRLLGEIELHNRKHAARISYEGQMAGEEFDCFLQSCDIGLSTQNPSGKFNDTSFPSKIFTYLTNGLRVVSVRIPVLENSDISDLLYFYNGQEPKDIAKTIMEINLSKDYNVTDELKRMDITFEKSLDQMIAEFY